MLGMVLVTKEEQGNAVLAFCSQYKALNQLYTANKFNFNSEDAKR